MSLADLLDLVQDPVESLVPPPEPEESLVPAENLVEPPKEPAAVYRAKRVGLGRLLDVVKPPPHRGGFAGIAEGFTEDASWMTYTPYAASVEEFDTLRSLWLDAKAVEDGTADEETLQRIVHWQEEQMRKPTIGYRVGRILRDLPAFVGEFLTGGAIASGGARKLLGKSVRELIERNLEGAAARGIARALTATAGAAAQVGINEAIAAPFGGGRVRAEAYERALPEVHLEKNEAGEVGIFLDTQVEDFYANLPAAIGSQLIEYVSERAGNMPVLDKVRLAEGKVLGWLAGKLGITPGEAAKEVLRRGGWSGVIPEYLEERLGAAMRAGTLVGEPEFGDFEKVWPGMDASLAELGAFLVPAGGAALIPGGKQKQGAPPGVMQREAPMPAIPPPMGSPGAERPQESPISVQPGTQAAPAGSVPASEAAPPEPAMAGQPIEQPERPTLPESEKIPVGRERNPAASSRTPSPAAQAAPKPKNARDALRALGGVDLRPDRYDLNNPAGRQALKESRELAEVLARVEDKPEKGVPFKGNLVKSARSKGRPGLVALEPLTEKLIEMGYFPGKTLGDISRDDVYEVLQSGLPPLHEIRAEEPAEQDPEDAYGPTPEWHMRGEGEPGRAEPGTEELEGSGMLGESPAWRTVEPSTEGQRAAAAIAEKLGRKVRFVEGAEFRGVHLGDSGIFLSAEDADPRAVVFHEIVHDLAAGEVPRLYALVRTADPEGLRAARGRYRGTGGMARDVRVGGRELAREETLASYTEDLAGYLDYLGTPEGEQAITALVRNNRTLLQRILDAIRNLLGRIGNTTQAKRLERLSKKIGKGAKVQEAYAARLIREAMEETRRETGDVAKYAGETAKALPPEPGPDDTYVRIRDGPSGPLGQLVAYQHFRTPGEKLSRREGGYVGGLVSDFERAETCATCGRKIVYAFWVRGEDGSVRPYGRDHLHSALGLDRPVSEKQAEQFVNEARAKENERREILSMYEKRAKGVETLVAAREKMRAVQRERISRGRQALQMFAFYRNQAGEYAYSFSPEHGAMLREAGWSDVSLDQPTKYAAAYHGSPHDFDKFESSKIGTGEGVQAFGHGLYFAGKREVAEYYRDSLAQRNPRARWLLDGKPLDREDYSHLYSTLDFNHGEPLAETIAELHRIADSRRGSPSLAPELYENAAKLLERYAPRLKQIPARLYEVDLAPAEDEYLLWDKPLSEQSEKVKAGLAEAAKSYMRDFRIVPRQSSYGGETWFAAPAGASDHEISMLRISGADYATKEDAQREIDSGDALWRAIRGERTGEAVARMIGTSTEGTRRLRSAGIRGIKYLDQSSRGAGEGTYNYVIFDEADVTIRAKYARPPRKLPESQVARVEENIERALAGEDIGGRPDLADTGPTAEISAIQQAVDVERGTPEQQSMEEANRQGRLLATSNPSGTLAGLRTKIRDGQPLSAVETFALRHIMNAQGTLMLRTEDPLAAREAILLNWAYRQSGSEASRAMNARRSAYNERVRGEEIMALILSKPTIRADRELARLLEERREPATTNARRDEIDAEINRVLEREAGKNVKVFAALREAGFDPATITQADWRDPTTATRLIRLISVARADWRDKAREFLYASMLSSPLTHRRNILGNLGNLAVGKYVQEIVESMVNLVVRDPDSPQVGELKEVLRVMLPSIAEGGRRFATAYRYESMALRGVTEEDISKLAEGIGGRAIGNRAFGVLRAISLDLLRAADEFHKGMIETQTIAQLAYREAKAEGIEDPETLRRRMNELIRDPGLAARSTREAMALAFQEQLAGVFGAVEKGALRLRDALDEAGTIPLVGTLLFPLVKTPLRLLRVGMRRTPVQWVGLVLDLVQTPFAGRFPGGRRALVRKLADAMIAAGIFWAVLGLVGDDEDGEPWITGSAPRKAGERGLQQRTYPARSIRIGNTWYSYGQTDPITLSVAATVDAAQAFRRDGTTAGLQALGTAVVDGMRDSTYLRTIGNLWNLYERRSAEGLLDFGVDTFVTPWVPNVIRAPLREADENLRETRIRKYDDLNAGEVVLKQLPYSLLPGEFLAPPPKYDLWGREVERTPLRLSNGILLERQISSGSPTKIDKMLLRWNERGDGPPYAPEQPDYYWRKGGKTYYWSDAEYEELVRDSGRQAADALLGLELNWDAPTQADIDQVKRAIDMARDAVRNELKSRRALSMQEQPTGAGR